ncbi:zinc-binding dehydrogenase [Microbacterium gorillae]|uniref:zinc-binding dehydrogenase n=1 Tax=Microbacterium gorillae TaxID=1231063 RepID=UPI003D96B72F
MAASVPAAAVLAPASPMTDVRLAPAALAKVWIGEGRPHETIAVPGVVLAAGEVLVQVELATVCGSDVHTVAGHRAAPMPLVLGHEYVGRITALGAEGARTIDGSRLNVGDRVTWSIFAACRSCDRCRRGMPQKCRALRKYGHERVEAHWELTGGFATHVHLRAGTAIVRVAEELPGSVLAPAACGTATAWAAVAALDDVVDLDGAVLLISGAGLIGLTATAIATERGARVVVSDPDPRRREQALRFGAAAVHAPGEDLSDVIAGFCESEVHAVLEASGARAAVLAAFDAVAVGGAIALVGSVFPTEAVPLDPERIVRTCLTMRGVHNYAPRDLVDAIAFLRGAAGRYPFEELVGAVLPLSEIDDAIALARSGEHVRVGIDPRR